MISIVIPSLRGYEEFNDGVVEAFKETCFGQEIEVLLIEEDQCFAKNVNQGLRKVKGDIVLVSNNDVTPLPGWSSWLINNSDKGIVSFSPRGDCGWCFGMSRKMLEEIGYLDEELVNSYEDYDYFIRAAMLGYDRILADRPYMIHEGGHTLNTIWGKFEDQSKIRLEQCEANKRYMRFKWPYLDINAVPGNYWALYGSKIMQEYSRGKNTRQV